MSAILIIAFGQVDAIHREDAQEVGGGKPRSEAAVCDAAHADLGHACVGQSLRMTYRDGCRWLVRHVCGSERAHHSPDSARRHHHAAIVAER
jgi:hypothetical protein